MPKPLKYTIAPIKLQSANEPTWFRVQVEGKGEFTFHPTEGGHIFVGTENNLRYFGVEGSVQQRLTIRGVPHYFTLHLWHTTRPRPPATRKESRWSPVSPATWEKVDAGSGIKDPDGSLYYHEFYPRDLTGPAQTAIEDIVVEVVNAWANTPEGLIALAEAEVKHAQEQLEKTDEEVKAAQKKLAETQVKAARAEKALVDAEFTLAATKKGAA